MGITHKSVCECGEENTASSRGDKSKWRIVRCRRCDKAVALLNTLEEE